MYFCNIEMSYHQKNITMKRLFLFAMVTLLSVLTMNAQQYYGRVQDSDGYTNIRRGPGTNYAIVRQYNSGDYLYYTPQKNGWSKVYSAKNANSFMGYMSTSRIVKVNPNSGYDGDAFLSGVITDPTDSYVNVRRGPGTNYAISSRLDVGTRIYYVRTGTGWVKVYDRGKNYLGYVAASRIR